MAIYDNFGVRTIINASGASTRVGGALMPEEVVDSMREAARESVSMAELQAAASRYISNVTGAEAGYVTSGASAGLTLATASIIAGCDLSKIDKVRILVDKARDDTHQDPIFWKTVFEINFGNDGFYTELGRVRGELTEKGIKRTFSTNGMYWYKAGR